MAYLRRLKNSPYWIAGYNLPGGGRTQRSTKTDDRREALRLAESWEEPYRKGMTEAQARRVLSDLHERLHGSPMDGSSLRDYLTRWLDQKKGATSPATYRAYKAIAAEFVAFLAAKGDQPINYLTKTHVAEWRDHCAKTAANRTANNKLKVIRVLLESAWRDGLATENPASKVQLLKAAPRVRRPMKEVEIKKVLSVADEEWRGLIIVGLYTVQRLGDVACLRWRNVDFEQKVISLVTRKGSRRVVVPFKGVKALEDLLNILSSKPHSEDTPLFPKAFQTVETQNGRVGSLSNQFADLLIQAKIRPEKSHKRSPENAGRSGRRASNTVSFHSLRHSGTSMMKNANVPHSIVQDIVGHDSAEISWLYTHVDEAAKAAALRKLPDITR